MEALENLVKSDAFFPIILALLVILLGLFCYFIISNKKRENLRRNRQEQPNTIQEEIKLLEDNPEPVQEEIKEEVVDLPLVDIPIPKVDDTEIVVEAVAAVTEVEEEVVQIPGITEKVVEDKVDASEIVEIEASVPLDKASDVGENVDLPEVANNYKEVPEEQVIIEESGPVVENNVNQNDLVEIGIEVPGMKEQAFDGVPAPTTTINEDIVYEEPKEYTGEKTEIFDFPDFSEVTGPNGELKKDVDVDEEIIKTANEYIASIMAK